jgi:hypothetical protein
MQFGAGCEAVVVDDDTGGTVVEAGAVAAAGFVDVVVAGDCRQGDPPCDV